MIKNINDDNDNESTKISRLDYAFSFLAYHLRILETQQKSSSAASNSSSSPSVQKAARNIIESSSRLYFLLKNIEIL